MKLIAQDPQSDWAVVDAPEGAPSTAAAAELLGVDAEALHAVFATAPDVAGLARRVEALRGE